LLDAYKKHIALILSGWMLVLLFTTTAFAVQPSFNMNSEAAILIHADSGKILYEKNPHKQLPPASVTKIMTLLLALEAIEDGRASLDDMVMTSDLAKRQSGTRIFLDTGEEQTLEVMLKGIAIESANDASVAVAEYLAGSVEGFADMMNKRAKELGMNDSYFVNPSGLPETSGQGNLMSAYDIALVSRELIKYPEVMKWLGTWMEPIRVGQKNEFMMVNKNKLLKGDFYYSGADGIKTGFTNEAGWCLSATAEKGNLRLISVVLKAPTSKVRFDETKQLLNWGFSTYAAAAVVEDDTIIAELAVQNGVVPNVSVVPASDLNVLVERGKDQDFEVQTNMVENVKAPVSKGEKLGYIVAFQDGEEVARVDLIARTDVQKLSLIGAVLRTWGEMIKSIFQISARF
jgi:D-alanyl-D-alanine carboxypeptidase (penicillin-binding protein 5/6)